MTLKIPKLKVRPRAVAQATPCAVEFSAMLACWAAHNDKMNGNECRERALALESCMANNAGKRGKIRKPTINYRGSKFAWQREVAMLMLLYRSRATREESIMS